MLKDQEVEQFAFCCVKNAPSFGQKIAPLEREQANTFLPFQLLASSSFAAAATFSCLSQLLLLLLALYPCQVAAGKSLLSERLCSLHKRKR